MSENNTNVNDILNALDDIRNKTTYAIYIPSKKREHMFKEISTAQEKRLVKCIIDNPVFGTQLIYTLREIIKENSADLLNIDELTVMDKLAICLNLRSKSIGSTFKHIKLDKTGKNVGEFDVNIDDVIKRINMAELPESKKFSNDDITIICSLPTIKDEYDLEIAMCRKLKDYEKISPDKASDMLESAFIGEIIKYIKNITIEMDGEVRDIPLSGLDFKVRQQFIEKLGSSLTADVLEYIKTYNNLVKGILTDIESDITIEVNPSFFTR